MQGCLNLNPVQIIPLHPIEATEDEKPRVLQNHTLMEGARRRLLSQWNPPRPRIRLEVELVYVVKTLLCQINSTENVHGSLCSGGCMSVAALDTSTN